MATIQVQRHALGRNLDKDHEQLDGPAVVAPAKPRHFQALRRLIAPKLDPSKVLPSVWVKPPKAKSTLAATRLEPAATELQPTTSQPSVEQHRLSEQSIHLNGTSGTNGNATLSPNDFSSFRGQALGRQAPGNDVAAGEVPGQLPMAEPLVSELPKNELPENDLPEKERSVKEVPETERPASDPPVDRLPVNELLMPEPAVTEPKTSPFPDQMQARVVRTFLGCIRDVREIETHRVRKFDESHETLFKTAQTDILNSLARTDILGSLDQSGFTLSGGLIKLERHMGGNKSESEARKQSGNPYICILHQDFGDDEKLVQFHTRFQASDRRKLYDSSFRICYGVMEERSGTGGIVSLAGKPLSFSLCGYLATGGEGHHLRQFTIGGLIGIGNDLRALTCWHSEASQGGKSKADQTKEQLVVEMFENRLLTKAYEPPYRVKHSPAKAKPPRVPFSSDKFQDVDFRGVLGELCQTGSEWGLVRVDDPAMRVPNCIEVEDSHSEFHVGKRLVYLHQVAPLSQGDDEITVWIASGVNGMVKASLSLLMSPMMLHRGKIVQVWTVEFDENNTQLLGKGDSGSWVVDAQSGSVYGHIIAGTDELGYVLPLKAVMEEIGECYLPSPFQCLAELAKINQSLNMDHAESYASQAMSMDVLSCSTSNPLANLIIQYGKHQFSPGFSFSDLDPASIFRYILVRAGGTVPSISELMEWFTSGPTPFWYLASNDVPHMLHELGLNPDAKPTFLYVPITKFRPSIAPDGVELGESRHPFLDYASIKRAHRKKFCHGLDEDGKLQIRLELYRIDQTRKLLRRSRPGGSRLLFDDITRSINAWRGEKESRQIGFTATAEALHDHPSTDARHEVSLSLRDFAQPLFRAEAIEIPRRGGLELKQSTFPCGNWTALWRYDRRSLKLIHLPANNIEWLDGVLAEIGVIRPEESDYYPFIQQGEVKSRHMEPICLQIPLTHLTIVPGIWISMPLLRWEIESRAKRMDSFVDKLKQTSTQQERIAVWRLGGSATKPTKLGHVLRDAAALYENMLMFPDEALVESNLFADRAFHIPRTLGQAYSSPLVDLPQSQHYHTNSEEGDPHSSVIMVDQLWMMIVDGKTVITLSPKAYGYSFDETPSFSGSIHEQLVRKLEIGRLSSCDIAAVTLNECIGSFFRKFDGRQKSPSDGLLALNCRITALAAEASLLFRKLQAFYSGPTASAPTSLQKRLFAVQSETRRILEDLEMISRLLIDQASCINDFRKIVDPSFGAVSLNHTMRFKDPLASSQLQSQVDANDREVNGMLFRMRNIEKDVNGALILAKHSH